MQQKKIQTIADFFLAICIFMTTAPYFIWGYENIAYAFCAVVIILYFITLIPKTTWRNSAASLFAGVASGLALGLLGASFSGAVFFGFFILFLRLLSDENLVATFVFLKKIFAVAILPGLILWFIHQAFNKDFLYIGEMPTNIIQNQLKVASGQGYTLYPFAIVLDYALSLNFYRLQGPFDEPGWLGTICFMMIGAGGFNKSKKSDVIILTAGFLSFSLAFYILIVAFFIFNGSVSRLKWLFAILCASIFFASFSFEILDEFILQRLVFSDGQISGYNRETDFVNQSFSFWLGSPLNNLIFGLPDRVSDGSSSYKVMVINSGLLGVFLLTIVYLMALIKLPKNFKITSTIFLALFFMSSLQRPDILKPFMYFVFLYAICLSRKPRGLAVSND